MGWDLGHWLDLAAPLPLVSLPGIRVTILEAVSWAGPVFLICAGELCYEELPPTPSVSQAQVLPDQDAGL